MSVAHSESSKRESLRRSVAAAFGVAPTVVEFRDATGGAKIDAFDGKVIRGTPIVFNSMSVDLFGFKERILPEAVNRTLREGIDVRALVGHDTDKVMGRNKAGTLALRKESDGLHARIEPPDTSYSRDVMESISRGDISGMSFGFQTLEDRWHIEDGIEVREVLDMRIFEVSIVAFPAYEETDVEVAKRSLGAFREMRAWRPSVAFRERQMRAGRR